MSGDGGDRLKSGDAHDEGLVWFPHLSLLIAYPSISSRMCLEIKVEEVVRQNSDVVIQDSYVPCISTHTSISPYLSLSILAENCGRLGEIYTDQDVPFMLSILHFHFPCLLPYFLVNQPIYA